MLFETKTIEQTKVCSKCNETKPVSAFYKMTSGIYGVAGECKKCNIQRSSIWRVANKRHIKHLHLMRSYNMSISEFEEILESQGYKCLLCGKEDKDTTRGLYVDHCHSSGKVRGLLCDRCNLAIGMFEDDIELLEKAKLYLETFKD